MTKLRVVGIDFSHMHMGDNLRMVAEHPACELVGVCDDSPERMAAAIAEHALPDSAVFTDVDECIAAAEPHLAVLCPPTAQHAEAATRVLARGIHVLIEKPFAGSLADADEMIAAAERSGRLLAINWPLVWVASHRTAKRVIDDGVIGRVLEVHYYCGNRGPLYHTAHKQEVTAEEVAAQKPASWFYKRDHGGGSLLDYLGYGVTLGSWYNGGDRPLDVTTTVDKPAGLEVDEHSVTVVRYATGLSKFETRWGTFTDPWTHQPQPKCGFVIVGDEGTVSSYDYEPAIQIQTRARPEVHTIEADPLSPPHDNPVNYIVDCLQHDRPVEGPLSPELSRLGQEIIDAAVQSATERRTISIASSADR